MNSSPIWSMSLLKGGNLETDRFTWKKCEPCKHSDSSLQAWDGSFPRTSEGTQPAYTLLQTTSLQNCEITDFCSVSHSVCGSSLWHPWQINTSAFLPPGKKNECLYIKCRDLVILIPQVTTYYHLSLWTIFISFLSVFCITFHLQSHTYFPYRCPC